MYAFKNSIFSNLSAESKNTDPYDLLICDPPTLQKGSVDIARDYPKIIRRLDSFMDVDSQLMMCINAPHIEQQSSKAFLLSKMEEIAPNYCLIEEITPPQRFIKKHKVVVWKY